MNRKQGVVYGVATVCALTLAVAATSLTGSGGGSGGGPVSFGAEAGPLGDLLAALQFGDLPSVGLLEPLLLVPGLVVFTVVSVETIRYVNVRSVAGTAVAAGVAVVVGVVAFAVFPRVVPDAPFDGSAVGMAALREGAERAPASGADIVLHLTPIVGLVALAGVVVAAVVRRGDDTEETTTEPIEARGPSEVASVGAAAGRAAEDLAEEASFENAVYRAWREMVDAVAADAPETTTPGEFADRAVAAGMDPEDVAELTSLFETVRYGDLPVTEERRRQAEAALRRIEATYAGDR